MPFECVWLSNLSFLVLFTDINLQEGRFSQPVTLQLFSHLRIEHTNPNSGFTAKQANLEVQRKKWSRDISSNFCKNLSKWKGRKYFYLARSCCISLKGEWVHQLCLKNFAILFLLFLVQVVNFGSIIKVFG